MLESFQGASLSDPRPGEGLVGGSAPDPRFAVVN